MVGRPRVALGSQACCETYAILMAQQGNAAEPAGRTGRGGVGDVVQKAVRDLGRARDPLRQARQLHLPRSSGSTRAMAQGLGTCGAAGRILGEDRRDRKHGVVGPQFGRTVDRNRSDPPEVTSVTLRSSSPQARGASSAMIRCSDSVFNCCAPRFTFSGARSATFARQDGERESLPAFADENQVECGEGPADVGGEPCGRADAGPGTLRGRHMRWSADHRHKPLKRKTLLEGACPR